MGTQSIIYLPHRQRTPLRSVVLLLFTIAILPLSAFAQTSALAVPVILPSAVVYDVAGNLYICETANHRIRKVDTTGEITTVAGTGAQGLSGDGGPAVAATLDSPQGIAVDAANNLYIADTHNHRIRRLSFTTGILTTIAGTSQGYSGDSAVATVAQLNLPTALTLDPVGNLYFADTGNHRIRRIDASTGIITTIAGDGTQGFTGDNGLAIAASIDSPAGLVADARSNLYLADTHNHRIRRIDAITGVITTVAGAGGQGFSGDTAAATAAKLTLPHNIAMDGSGNLYIADTQNHRIRRVDAITGIITTVAGDGTQGFAGDGGVAISASLDSPRAVTLPASNLITIADSGNQRIRQLTARVAPAAAIQTIAGLGLIEPGTLTLTAPSVIAYGSGQLTATLASATPATGAITFLDSKSFVAVGSVPLAANTATLPIGSLAVGAHSFTATYVGDPAHSPAESTALNLTITPLQLTAITTPASLLYGQAIPPITGTLTGVLAQDAAALSVTFATTANASSPAGSYPVTAILGGSAAGNYSVAPPASLTIAPAPTTISLGTPVIASAATTLTSHVASTTSGTPTGSVTLLDGTTSLSTAVLSSTADAVFTINSLVTGSHSLTALYSGSANFTPSVSSPQLITIGASTPSDFSIRATGLNTQTIVSGASASFNFAVQLQGNLSSPITLSATGLPNLATASFNPPTLPPGSATNFTLTIATPNTTASNNNHADPSLFWMCLSFPLVGFAWNARSRHPVSKLLAAALITLTLVFATGCGDRVNTVGALSNSAKSFTITVTGTATTPSGTVLQHAATVTLLVDASN